MIVLIHYGDRKSTKQDWTHMQKQPNGMPSANGVVSLLQILFELVRIDLHSIQCKSVRKASLIVW